MILRRLGNKKKIAKEIQKYFPPHKIYIEPFFGAGGMFFNKPKAHNNILNDLDSDVFNLFQVVMNQKEELEKAFYMMPIHSDLLEYWKQNKETDPIKKALRFLTLKNLTLYGQPNVYRYGNRNLKNHFFNVLDETYKQLENVQFMNYDFREIISKISLSKNIEDAFIYSDPPYIHMKDKRPYDGLVFNDNDVSDCFNVTFNSGIKGAMSEFDNDFIIQEAKKRNLNIIYIGERQNLKNRRTEILITNYKLHKTLF